MSEPLSPELEEKARELAARIASRSQESILEMARRLVVCGDETLFGDTEFALRDQALGLVADAYAERLEKKVAMSARRSTARTATAPRRSTATGTKRSRRSAEQSNAGVPTTTADAAEKDAAPGTVASG